MTQTCLKGLAVILAVAGCGAGQAPIDTTGTGGSTTSTLCGGDPTGSPTPGGLMAREHTAGPSFSQFPPTFGPTVTAAVAPPAISGGTLRIMADGRTAVAADPDRDQVYVVDLANHALTSTFELSAGDEPGRVVIDGVGRAHVALRRGGALVSFDPRLAPTAQTISRRSACASPRGLAYDAGMDLVHVACADGQLLSFPAAGGAAVRTVLLDRDLRDVVVDGPRLRVSRFRSAEILTVESDGTISERTSPQGFRAVEARNTQLFSPSTAYKMEAMPNGDGVVMVHQRGLVDEVQPVSGGYGGPDACQTIVHPAVTMVAADGSVKSGPAMAGLVLPVDLAVSHDSSRIAVVSAGNANNRALGDSVPNLPQVFVTTLADGTDTTVGCRMDGTHAPCPTVIGGGPPILVDPSSSDTGSGGSTGVGGSTGTAGAGGATEIDGGIGTGSGGPIGGSFGTGTSASKGGEGVACGAPDPSVPQVAMQPIAVAFDGKDNVVIQSREPALLALPGNITITLSTESRADTGHQVFHANAGGFLACASCHAEGNDDGRVWDFTCSGKRRTQSLQTGLKGTEPFHWSGDETNFATLMNDVFVGRMSGPLLQTDQNNALFGWIDAQPRPARTAPADAAAVAHGQALFNDPARAGCATCHAGLKFTNAQTVDVGTGAPFQVPSLVGVGTRGPYMHDGCAKTLADRFTNAACGGGDKHGHTSDLTAGELADLVAYLNTI